MTCAQLNIASAERVSLPLRFHHNVARAVCCALVAEDFDVASSPRIFRSRG
jgi:hypothetical protein